MRSTAPQRLQCGTCGQRVADGRLLDCAAGSPLSTAAESDPLPFVAGGGGGSGARLQQSYPVLLAAGRPQPVSQGEAAARAALADAEAAGWPSVLLLMARRWPEQATVVKAVVSGSMEQRAGLGPAGVRGAVQISPAALPPAWPLQ